MVFGGRSSATGKVNTLVIYRPNYIVDMGRSADYPSPEPSGNSLTSPFSFSAHGRVFREFAKLLI